MWTFTKGRCYTGALTGGHCLQFTAALPKRNTFIKNPCIKLTLLDLLKLRGKVVAWRAKTSGREVKYDSAVSIFLFSYHGNTPKKSHWTMSRL